MGKATARRAGVRWLALVALVASVAIAGWYYGYRNQAPPVPPDLEEAFPLPPFSESAFLNTKADAHYVGMDACKGCHNGNYQSYLHTAHSKALSDLDPAAEPPDGSFEHKLSGRSYRIYRQAGQMRQEEVLRTADGTEISRIDLPIRYLIGSGHFSRSYLVEVDGFLHESPITWYASKKSWDMSPGYDSKAHYSFERPIRIGCISCHAGRAEAADGAVNRLTIHEKSIGCESCHGPGSLHVDFHHSGQRLTTADDATIVNPGKLPRSRLESICALCHLNGVASVYVRGRQIGDFRPGMPLSDYRIDYHFDAGNKEMTVVGHIEQLRLSACYQKSPDLSCITCHDPHEREKPRDPVAYYRQKCLNCHNTQACRLTPAERLKKDAADNCMTCHMPRGDTDIPHVAFTHHRIGPHPPPRAPDTGAVPQLLPIGENSALSVIDRQRNLGLAYAWLSTNGERPIWTEAYLGRAQKLLDPVYDAKLRDGNVLAALAQICWLNKEYLRADAFAQEALAAADLKPEERAFALQIRAGAHMRNRDFGPAAGFLEQLVRLQRKTEDWRLLGTCYLSLDQPQKALSAFQQALAIRPSRPDVHAGLALAYQRLGDAARARDHEEKAQWLRQHEQE